MQKYENSDLTFITNEQDQTLKDRFATLIRDSRFFDALVGYFYTSGFYAIYPSLEKTEKVRILIGISTNRQTFDLMQQIQSHKEINDQFGDAVKSEMEESENRAEVEEGVKKFLGWLKDGKLEIKAYPDERVHAKLYIMTFQEGDRDKGRVITGSSNLTQSGLVDNLEFNVELKNRADYEYAKEKFEELWQKGVDVSDKYVETIERDTWLREDITPYELYLKFLYEYFREEINDDQSLEHSYRPENFKELQYQEHAVINAKKIIDEHGGVFLSDVVGLGKTYMATMLCQELKGKTLVLAPPHLIDEHNQGSWENSFRNFGFRAKDYKCYSIGLLDKIIDKGWHEGYENVIVDEAHRFRTEATDTYTKLSQICRGKRVILVTATPYNNSPDDLLSQIKLFQRTRRSTIPNLPNIEGFFKALEKRLKGLDRKQDRDEYLSTVRDNSRQLRDKVLKYLMVRRTRSEIEKYYGDDLKKQGLKFPTVAEPKPVYYEFSEEEDNVFFETIRKASTEFKYSRYTAMLYHKGITEAEKQSQRNMVKFMKILLVKRLESSFYAFKQTLDRFIISYEKFLWELDKGDVYVSRKHTQKVFDCLERGDLERVEKYIAAGKVEKYSAEEFSDKLREDIVSDLDLLKEIREMWKVVTRDPKLLAFKEKLAKEPIIQKNKIIIFTESQETATYLGENLTDIFDGEIIRYSGDSSDAQREEVLENFDANADFPKDDYRVLITTDILAEGVNLHRANTVINYDIPWNPTRVMQRVGRINRVDTGFDKIFTYTFFPTDQSNEQIKLRECAEAKIKAFISLLGADARLLTEEEDIEAHVLFSRLVSKEILEGEEESDCELKYLQVIRKIRDENPEFFSKIKLLPKKARTGRKSPEIDSGLLTYFRRGKAQKFYFVSAGEDDIAREVDFVDAARMFESKPAEKQSKVGAEYYDMLDKNLSMLDKVEQIEEEEFTARRGSRDNAARLSVILQSKQVRNFLGFTEDDVAYIKRVIEELDSGGMPKKLSQKVYAKIEKTPDIISNPLKLLGILKSKIPESFLSGSQGEDWRMAVAKKEIILSEHFTAK